jgi:hypothetical protein
VTSDSGNYLFDAVQVGRYSLTVELQGFKRFVSSDNVVNIGDPDDDQRRARSRAASKRPSRSARRASSCR